MTLGGKTPSNGQYVSSVWTFPAQDVGRQSPYRWYGTLPTGLVDRLLDLYAPPGSTVLDPFCGSGTTLLTCAHRGLEFAGMDVNPLAVLLSKVRLMPPGEEQLRDAWVTAKDTLTNPEFRRSSRRRLRQHLGGGFLAYSARWIHPEVLDQLWLAARAIAGVDDLRCQAALFIAFSGVVRDVANVDPRCTHHLVTKIKPLSDCVQRIDSMLASPWPGASAPGDRTADYGAFVQQADVTSWTPAKSHDLVVVHPPYLGVIHYNLIHRLVTDLLHLVSISDAPVSLAGLEWEHAQIKLADMSTDNERRYDGFIRSLSDVLIKSTCVGGRAVVIIGDQRHRGMIRHPFTSYIRELEERGFALEESFIWVLQNNSGMHVLRRGHFIDHNYVLVFRRLP